MKKKDDYESIYKLSLAKLKSEGAQSGSGLNNESGEAPLMSAEKLDSLLKLSGGDSPSDAELYAYYRDMYKDAAESAAKNAYGTAAAHTGGYASTYASAEANEAYISLMKELGGAYEQAKEQRDKNAASAVQTAISFADKAAKYGDYSYYEALGADMSGAKRSDALSSAVEAAKYGNYSLLEELGYDTGLLRYSELIDIAEKMAKYGDYSGLEAIGVNASSAKEKELLEKAETLAKYGDYSLLKELYAGFKEKRSKISVTVQNGAEKAYANGGFTQLKSYLDRQVSYGQIDENDVERIISAVTGG